MPPPEQVRLRRPEIDAAVTLERRLLDRMDALPFVPAGVEVDALLFRNAHQVREQPPVPPPGEDCVGVPGVEGVLQLAQQPSLILQTDLLGFVLEPYCQGFWRGVAWGDVGFDHQRTQGGQPILQVPWAVQGLDLDDPLPLVDLQSAVRHGEHLVGHPVADRERDSGVVVPHPIETFLEPEEERLLGDRVVHLDGQDAQQPLVQILPLHESRPGRVLQAAQIVPDILQPPSLPGEVEGGFERLRQPVAFPILAQQPQDRAIGRIRVNG
ncbi:MAG: hypothetical protein PVF83_14435 [Anaerolineales bacterium]